MNKFKSTRKKISSLKKQTAKSLQDKHPVLNQYVQEKKLLLPGVSERSKQLVAGAALAGSLLIGPLKEAPLAEKPAEERVKIGLATSEDVEDTLKNKLASYIPHDIGKLTPEQEDKICKAIKDVLGVDVCTELEGEKLNFDYAWTGYEQHLYRYPGDSLEQHDEELIAGIAPGLGAWGYFAPSKEEMSKDEYLKEKYYVVVQTLYFDDWHLRSDEIYKFYKHRKMIMINPENGTACVAVVGDAGPAKWTGKQYGGSPEVMKALDLHDEWRKGKVLLLFVDDPDDKIPLGPIDYNLLKGQPVLA
jgi:hypothetical protein